MRRLQSYLAPSLPHGFFRAIADDLRETLGISVELTFEPRTSGPVEGEADPLSAGLVRRRVPLRADLPVVARATLDPVLSDRVRDALLTSASRGPGRFSEFGFVGFAAVEHSIYATTARLGRVRHRMVDEPTHPGLRAASG